MNELEKKIETALENLKKGSPAKSTRQ